MVILESTHCQHLNFNMNWNWIMYLHKESRELFRDAVNNQ